MSRRVFSGTRTRLSRLPLRVRLVAGFSATMFLVLTAAGAFVYWRVQFALDRQLDGDLTTDTRLLAPLVGPDGGVSTQGNRVVGDELYQVLDRQGRILSASPTLTTRALVSGEVVSDALEAPLQKNVGNLLPFAHDPLRVYASSLPGADHQQAAVLVVAVRRDHRDEALLELLAQLAAAGFGALFVTSLVGERLARFALQPVERYRAQADDIIAGATGVRLEVPPGRNDEITRLGATFNTMLDALEEAVDRERRFVNDASHELRTPLTLLTTRVQLAQRRSRSVAEHERVLAEIETDVVRLVALADHLLQVGHEGPDDLEDVGSVGVDLAGVAGQLVTRRNALTRATSHAGEVRLVTGEPVAVRLPAAAVEQLLGNLLDNALRHGAEPVSVTVDRVGPCGRLTVVDEGPGMEPELLATATRRFTRAPASRSGSGFGLGLSLVESIVARSNGELRLCFGGRHERTGTAYDVACTHGDAMTVTVLLPLA